MKPQARIAYRIAYDFHEQHQPASMTPQYWDATAADLSATAERHRNDPFLLDLLAAVYDQLEREGIENSAQPKPKPNNIE